MSRPPARATTIGDFAEESRTRRAKRFFTASAPGVKAVAHAQRTYQRMLKGLRVPGLADA